MLSDEKITKYQKVYKIEFLILIIILFLGGMFFFYTQRTDAIRINREGIKSIFLYKNKAIIKSSNNSKLIEKIKKEVFHSLEPITEEGFYEDIFGQPDKIVDEGYKLDFYYDYTNSLVSVSSLCDDYEVCSEWYISAYPKDVYYKDFFPEYIINNLPDNINIDVVDEDSELIFIIYGDKIEKIIWR